MSYRAKHSLSNIAKNDDTHDVRISPESLLYIDLLLLLLLAACCYCLSVHFAFNFPCR